MDNYYHMFVLTLFVAGLCLPGTEGFWCSSGWDNIGTINCTLTGFWCPPGWDNNGFWCPSGWDNNGTSCYYIDHNDTVVYVTARQKCLDIDGSLTTIEEMVENTFLLNRGPLVYGNDYWIGYKKVPASNSWTWEDGSSSTWDNWDPGEPDGDGDCARLTSVHDGKWRDRSCTDFMNPYICERLKECGYVTEVVDAGPPSLNVSRNIVGTVVNYTCNVGWIFPDNQITNEITCELGGEWSAISNCQIVVCGSPPVLANTIANSTANSYLSVVSYECNSGYWFSRSELNKTREIQCQLDALWSVNITACEPVTCLSPISPFSTWNNNATGIGATVNYTCDVGYEFPDNSTWKEFECEADGNWFPNATQCQIKRCAWPNIPNSKPDTAINEYGTTVHFICDTGYRYNDSATNKHAQCLDDKSWDTYIPPCDPVKCPLLANVSNALMNSTEHMYGSSVNFSCLDGYFFPDSSSFRIIKCNKHAEWTAKVPPCRLLSEIPEVPMDVYHVVDEAEGSVSVGSIAVGLVVTVLVAMVLLDVVTFKRQIDHLRQNLAGCTERCCPNSGESTETEEHRVRILEHEHMDNIDVESPAPSKRSSSRQALSESQLLGSLASLKSNKVAPFQEPVHAEGDGKEKETIWEKDEEQDGTNTGDLNDEDLDKFLIDDEIGNDLLKDVNLGGGVEGLEDMDLDAELEAI